MMAMMMMVERHGGKQGRSWYLMFVFAFVLYIHTEQLIHRNIHTQTIPIHDDDLFCCCVNAYVSHIWAFFFKYDKISFLAYSHWRHFASPSFTCSVQNLLFYCFSFLFLFLFLLFMKRFCRRFSLTKLFGYDFFFQATVEEKKRKRKETELRLLLS